MITAHMSRQAAGSKTCCASGRVPSTATFALAPGLPSPAYFPAVAIHKISATAAETFCCAQTGGVQIGHSGPLRRTLTRCNQLRADRSEDKLVCAVDEF